VLCEHVLVDTDVTPPPETASVDIEDLQSSIAGLNDGLEATRRALAEMSGNLARGAADLSADDAAARIADLEWELGEVTRERDRLAEKVEAQKLLTSEVMRKYERAVHERNMIEQGMNTYRQAVGVAKKVMPTQAYFRARKIVRGH